MTAQETSIALQMKAAVATKKLVPNYQIIRHHVLENCTHRCETPILVPIYNILTQISVHFSHFMYFPQV
jgi:hypothetical protein